MVIIDVEEDDGSKDQHKQTGIQLENSLMTVSVDCILKSMEIYQAKDFIPYLIGCESSEGSLSSCQKEGAKEEAEVVVVPWKLQT